jgi:5-methylcytosine-specific restriction endonuclease McrA
VSYSKTKKIKIGKYDALWSKLVRDRDKQCLYCGRRDYLAAHHYIRRGIKATRLQLDNGITLCPAHHTFSTEFSAHRTEQTFKQWFEKKFAARASRMRALSQTHMSERQAILEFKETYNV